MRLFKNDPVTCARYFDHRCKEMFKVILHSRGPFAPYEVQDYFYRYVVQKRGSIHVHILLWIKSASVFDENSVENRALCEDFIDEFVSCCRDESLREIIN